jgi:hypothetical protein
MVSKGVPVKNLFERRGFLLKINKVGIQRILDESFHDYTDESGGMER